MKIIVCKTAGLCAGAKRAYDAAKSSAESGKITYIYKEILHNEKLIDDLNHIGAKTIFDLNNLDDDCVVVLRAHGEEKNTYAFLQQTKYNVIDMMCPNVKRVREIALQKANDGYKIIVVGNKKNGKIHDETKSLLSFLDSPILVTSIDDIASTLFEKGVKYFAVCQTTYSASDYNKIIDLINQHAKGVGCEFEYANTICSFPIVNIEESKKLAQKSNIMVVLGSKSSSNTTELYNSIKGICPTVFDDDYNRIFDYIVACIKNNKLNKSNLVIGVVAGASTLKSDLQQLVDYLIKCL